MSTRPGGQGTFAAVKNIAATALAVGHTRLELLGNELEIARAMAMRKAASRPSWVAPRDTCSLSPSSRMADAPTR